MSALHFNLASAASGQASPFIFECLRTLGQGEAARPLLPLLEKHGAGHWCSPVRNAAEQAVRVLNISAIAVRRLDHERACDLVAFLIQRFRYLDRSRA